MKRSQTALFGALRNIGVKESIKCTKMQKPLILLVAATRIKIIS